MARGRPKKRKPAADATSKQIRDRIHYISESTETDFDASSLTLNERRLLVTMADPRINVEGWTIKQVCEHAGVTYDAYRKAMANPDYTAAMNSVVQATIKQSVLPLIRAGVKFAMEGSFRHWEALMKMGGQIEQGDSDKDIVIRFASPAAPLIIDAETSPVDEPIHTLSVRKQHDESTASTEPSNDADLSV